MSLKRASLFANVMANRQQNKVLRTAFFFLLLLSVSVATAAAADEPNPEATPAPEAAAAEAAAAESAEEELPPLNCKPQELLEKVGEWSVDCVALWLQNLGFPELRGAFIGNKVDGPALKGLTMDVLKGDYGVSDEDQRKKIYYNLKDVLKKDNSTGNTNNYAEMFFWCLPFLGIYKWITVKYDKEIAKAMKRYKKWQEVSDPRATGSWRSSLADSSRCPLLLLPRPSWRLLVAGSRTLTASPYCPSTGAQPSEARRARRVRGRDERVDLRSELGCRRKVAEEEEGGRQGWQGQKEARQGRVESLRTWSAELGFGWSGVCSAGIAPSVHRSLV